MAWLVLLLAASWLKLLCVGGVWGVWVQIKHFARLKDVPMDLERKILRWVNFDFPLQQVPSVAGRGERGGEAAYVRGLMMEAVQQAPACVKEAQCVRWRTRNT